VLIPDVNVLVYAHRVESPDHDQYARWLRDLVAGVEPFALSDLALSGFLRIVTNPRIWRPATEPPVALEFVRRLRAQCDGRCLLPGPDHWAIFVRLYSASGARGKVVADAYHAALAIEYGCTLVTCDSDFARFPGLRWRHPLHPSD
jgi:uncharacterized protein